MIAVFDPRSLVELDYGGLCDFLTWDELDDDRSVRELGLLEALERREFPRSAEIYQGARALGGDPRSRVPELTREAANGSLRNPATRTRSQPARERRSRSRPGPAD